MHLSSLHGSLIAERPLILGPTQIFRFLEKKRKLLPYYSKKAALETW